MPKTLPAAKVAEAAERAVKLVSEKYKVQFAGGLCCKHLLVGRIVKEGIDFKTSLTAATVITSSVSRSLGVQLDPVVQFGRGYFIMGFINPDILDLGGFGPGIGPSAPAKKK